METVTNKENIIRIRPRSFENGWKEDLLAVGVHIPDEVPTVSYTPVAHSPMPFSVEVDLNTLTLTKVVRGVMPNAMYRGRIYSWEEFCELIKKKQTESDEDKNNQ